MGDTDVVCKIKKSMSTKTLLMKSTKFFSFATIIGLIISKYIHIFVGIDPIYFYLLMGLTVSLVATYYKFRMWYDPSYRPNCNCAGKEDKEKGEMLNGVLSVLDHKKSAIFLNVPNTVWGILYYVTMIMLNYNNVDLIYDINFIASIMTCCGSAYLWYTMVYEVRYVCVLCSTIHASSFLMLLRVIM